MDTETKVDNSKHFRKVVRDFNTKTGFTFKLTDKTVSDKYAHAVHEDAKFSLKGQLDPDTDYIYGIDVKVEDLSFDLGRDTTREDLLKILQTDAFKWRLANIKILQDLAREIGDRVNLMKYDLLSDSVKEIEKDETYDLITRTARKLYKD